MDQTVVILALSRHEVRTIVEIPIFKELLLELNGVGLMLHYIQHSFHTLTVLKGSEVDGVVDLATVEWIVLPLDLVHAGDGTFSVWVWGWCWFCFLWLFGDFLNKL